jgi:hypothetical protein
MRDLRNVRDGQVQAVAAPRPAPVAFGPLLAGLWAAFALATLLGRMLAH